MPRRTPRRDWAGCSGSPAVIGQPLRPVTLRPPPFAEGSPCQNILVPGIVAVTSVRFRHRDYVDGVTEPLSLIQPSSSTNVNCVTFDRRPTINLTLRMVVLSNPSPGEGGGWAVPSLRITYRQWQQWRGEQDESDRIAANLRRHTTRGNLPLYSQKHHRTPSTY